MQSLVTLHAVESLKVAEIGEIIPTREDCGSVLGRCSDEVFNYIQQQGKALYGPDTHIIAGGGITLFYDPEHQRENIRAGVAIPISNSIPGNERVKVYDLPAYPLAASIFHHGDLNTMPVSHMIIFSWLLDHGYRISGPSREIYRAFHGETSPDNIVELQFPVEKIG